MKNTVENKKSIFLMKNEVYSWVVNLETQIIKALARREPFLADHNLWNAQRNRAMRMNVLVKTWKSQCELSLNNDEPFEREFFMNMIIHMEEWSNDIDAIESGTRIRSIFSKAFKSIADQQLNKVSEILLIYGALYASEDDMATSSHSASLPSSSSNDDVSSNCSSLNRTSSGDEQDMGESSMGSSSQSSSNDDIQASLINLQHFLQTRDFVSVQGLLDDDSLSHEQMVELADWFVDEVGFNPLQVIDAAMESDNVDAINALINQYDNNPFKAIQVKIAEHQDKVQGFLKNKAILTQCLNYISRYHGRNKSNLNEISDVLKKAENALAELFPGMRFFVDQSMIESENFSTNKMLNEYLNFLKDLQNRIQDTITNHESQINQYTDYQSKYTEFHNELKKNRINAIKSQCLVDISPFGLRSRPLSQEIAERIFHRTLHLHALFKDEQGKSFLMKAIAAGKTNIAVTMLQNLIVTDCIGSQIRSGSSFNKTSMYSKLRLSPKLIEMLSLCGIFNVVDQNGNTLTQQIMINKTLHSKERSYLYQCVIAKVINPQYKNNEGKTITTVKNERGETLLHLASRELLGYQNYCLYSHKEPDVNVMDEYFGVIQFCINHGANILEADEHGIVSWSNLFELLTTSMGDKVRNLLQNDFKNKLNYCGGKPFYQHEANGKVQHWSFFQRSVLNIFVNTWCESSTSYEGSSSSNTNYNKIIEPMIKDVIDAYRFKEPDDVLLKKINHRLEWLENAGMADTKALYRQVNAILLQHHSSHYSQWVPARYPRNHDNAAEDCKEASHSSYQPR